MWGNLVLALMSGIMINKSLIHFLLMSVAMFSSCSLIRGQTMVGVIVMAISSKSTYAWTIVFSALDLMADHCRSTPLLETPGHSQTSLAQSLAGSLLLSPGPWCAHGFVCVLQESVSPVLWKFCNKILLASKVKFPRNFQSLCKIPRLGNLLWPLDLTQEC